MISLSKQSRGGGFENGEEKNKMMSKEVQAKLDKWFSDYGKEQGHNPTWEEMMEMKDRLLWEEIFKEGE